MALQKQAVSFTFKEGADTKRDPFSLPIGKLTSLVNGEFKTPGRITKRNGYGNISNSILGGGTISAGAAVMTRASELLLADKTNLYSYDSANTAWQSKGVLPSVTVTNAPIAVNQYSIAGYDTAILSNLQCSVYEKWSGGVSGTYIGADYSVTDTATGQVVFTGTIGSRGGLASNVSCPRVLALGSNFLIYFVDVSVSPRQLFVVVVATSAPQTIVSTTALTAAGAGSTSLQTGNTTYDVAVASSIAYIVFPNGTSAPGGVTVFGCLSASPSTVTYTKSLVNAGTASTQTVCIFPDLFTGGPVIGYNNTATAATLYAAFNTTLSSTLGSGTLEAAQNCNTICGVSTSAVAVAFSFFYSTALSSSAYDMGYTRTNTVGAAYAIGTAASYLRGVMPVATPFLQNATVYVPLVFDSSSRPTPDNIQSTYFIADAAGNTVARFYPGTAGGHYQNELAPSGSENVAVPHTISLGGNQWMLPAVNSYRLVSQGAQYYFVGALYGVTLTFADATNGFGHAVLANTLHIGGGSMQMYDGTGKLVEHGFNYYPYAITSAVSGTTGSMADGTYQYQVVYEWTDGYGQIHRSTPSVAISVVVAGQSGAGKVTLTIPTLRLTGKQGTRQALITVYRTKTLLTTFYQVNNLGNAAATILLNDPTVDSVTYVDKLADASIATNPQIYTTGGVVANAPPNPLINPIVHVNRVIGIDSTNKLQLFHSKQVIPTAPVEFSATFTLNVDPRGGDTTVIASLDEKLVIFKDSQIFIMPGQGPDSTGGQNDWTQQFIVSADVGCVTPRSVVLTRDGLMFQSRKGLYLLGRDLSISYIGAEAESLIPAAGVVSATVIPSTNQVRFGLNNNTVAVYDTLVGQWGIFSGGAFANGIVDAVVWQNLYVPLTSAGVVRKETAGQYNDYNAQFYGFSWTTGWLSFAGIQGFQRVYRMLVLANYSPDDQNQQVLTITINHDFATTAQQLVTNWQDGNNSPNVTTSLRIGMQTQKCQSVQVAWSDSWGGAQYTGAADYFSGLTFEVGLKKGVFKLPSTRTYS